MANLMESLYNIRLLDELATKKSFIHSIHPLIKLLTTIAYLLVVVSYGKYDLLGLLPLVFYPVLLISIAELPYIPLLKRMLLALPFVIGIGIFNPIFDHRPFMVIYGISISWGWVSFFGILFKCGLTVLAVSILIATTSMTAIAYSLRMLKVPRLLVLQLLLTFRYISVLIEEAARVIRAYSLRAPLQKGVKIGDWGSLTGNLLLRTFDRAQRVYEAMGCRGFQGDYYTGRAQGLSLKDVLYFLTFMMIFLTARFYNVPEIIGYLLTGAGK